ncbi:MAG TPA: 2-amino-4-hydroxy-6-hydroxymethyldihydropteridine diphosphokinase [Steroidobacteraceae bacterium]|nr:2-amino-4-hydroxy-6-hydroxymethyldihydropteridine diphosphokinase [Steroidobacteraceae bacterium]
MDTTWRPAYVAIGSNLHDPPAALREARARISALAGTRLIARSRTYRSAPMGPPDQPDFLNAAAGLLTTMDARGLLEALLSIERTMGRDRRERWGPRIIDLDLIWIAGAPIDEPGLRVPHPGVRDRNFVLYPLADIAPTLAIPGCGRVSELQRRAGDAGLSVLYDE